MNLTPIRAAHIARVDAAADRNRNARHSGGMPYELFSAGIWLVANGLTVEPCEGERWFGYGPDAYRDYLAKCSPNERIEEIALGRDAVFGGRHPIYREPIAPAVVTPLGWTVREAA